MIKLFTRSTLLLALLMLLPAAVRAEDVPFTKETLDNGLTVIYAPMGTAPVVHVRVLYHVGSRDERDDRQGFAHMFEHMMFRGSAHVPPEEHMKLIGIVGGESNAFTSFDQTTYVNTIPSNALQMALYLEADRMASFKVNDLIFKTERYVVAEEWRMRYANQPLGPMMQDLLRTAFHTHTYRWTPIGDMDQLRAARTAELQEFFNTYYLPNNACLVICGKFDDAATRKWVHDYFGWIPKGVLPQRVAQTEPPQTQTRRLVVEKPNVALTNLEIAFKAPAYRSDDWYALSVLGDVLASGRTGRLDRELVNSENPKCVSVGAGGWQLEDPSLFNISAVLQRGEDSTGVEKEILTIIDNIKTDGVSVDELTKIKAENRQSILRSRDTAQEVASQLAEEQVFGGDAGRVNEMIARLATVTPEQVQAVAVKYLVPTAMTVVEYKHGNGPPPATQAAKAEATEKAPVAPSTQPVPPRVSSFPKDYPTTPPISDEVIQTVFDKGVETPGDPKVITLTDKRLPLANVTLYLRGGSDNDPPGKEGLSELTAAMMRRGSAGESSLAFSDSLESRGISIEVSESNDTTRLSISCTSDQLDFAADRAGCVLAAPNFSESEFATLKEQTIDRLQQALSSPASVATRDLQQALYGDSPLGRQTTPQSLASISLADVEGWYKSMYRLDGAFVILSGDVAPEHAVAVAGAIVHGYGPAGPAPASVKYEEAKKAPRRIILVDNPQGRQATIRMAVPAYTLRSDDKFAGSIAGQILSAGIESRLNKYVRAEKGLTYGCYAYFRPGRHGGEFSATVDTKPETAAAAIEAMFKVFGDMRKENVTDAELADAKRRVAGGMAMEAQTIAQQAGRRGEQILNDYPIDYYDKYPARVAEVSADQVQKVMNDYVKDDEMAIVVVAPAEAVREQLSKLGPVTEVPMPAQRPESKTATTQPSSP